MSEPTPPLLLVRGSKKNSGGRRVVDDVSFDVSAGEAAALGEGQMPTLEPRSEGRRVRCFHRKPAHV
jgi:hypothetical protein